ncbi:serine/threonine-protein kinase, partial [Mycolicibacterium mucogenicum]|uniref:serine/threonine-protein kinase n=1 Tax=Mycolicibacterium mucogenicum TaxID=56689 RepID=UPI001F239422
MEGEIGGYRIVEMLGAGGMGEVYLVEHPRLPRRDALKLLDAGVSRSQEFRSRFRREAELQAQLRHPHIITVYDRGEHEGRLWLAMEYVDGEDVAKLLRRQRTLPSRVAMPIIAGAGDALDYAYAANILVALGPDGQPSSVKLADFGIAKAAGDSTSLTSTGVTIGTMSYIAPEAIEGRELDNRADLYSLACTAFQMLTGSLPYPAGTIPALMMSHLSEPIPSIT